MTYSEIRRRPLVAPLEFAGLHPVLRRVYALRGVSHRDELNLSLERLLPVSSLDGVGDAARLLAGQRNGRVLVIGDFDADEQPAVRWWCARCGQWSSAMSISWCPIDSVSAMD